MIRKTLSLVILALYLAMTACTSITGSAIPVDDKHTPLAATSPSKTICFPRQEKTNGERAVMEALTGGKLVLVDNCIRVEGVKTPTSYLLIWPPDFNVSIGHDTIEIINEENKVVASLGDLVKISGGGIPLLSMLPTAIQKQVSSQCIGPYWIIGDEVTKINP